MTEPNDTSDPTAVPDRVVRRSTVVNATPQAIFDLLADPSKHSTFDGSGTVRRTVDESPDRLELGSKFGMKMKMGVPYKMTNEVVEFDEPTLIAWRHLGGHVWRYRLTEVDGGTEVTEEFDWRPSKAAHVLKVMKAPEKNTKSIEATLARFGELFPDDA
jgi:uncharacterized protein YndB with AHSA1/START domain